MQYYGSDAKILQKLVAWKGFLYGDGRLVVRFQAVDEIQIVQSPLSTSQAAHLMAHR